MKVNWATVLVILGIAATGFACWFFWDVILGSI